MTSRGVVIVVSSEQDTIEVIADVVKRLRPKFEILFLIVFGNFVERDVRYVSLKFSLMIVEEMPAYRFLGPSLSIYFAAK